MGPDGSQTVLRWRVTSLGEAGLLIHLLFHNANV